MMRQLKCFSMASFRALCASIFGPSGLLGYIDESLSELREAELAAGRELARVSGDLSNLGENHKLMGEQIDAIVAEQANRNENYENAFNETNERLREHSEAIALQQHVNARNEEARQEMAAHVIESEEMLDELRPVVMDVEQIKSETLPQVANDLQRFEERLAQHDIEFKNAIDRDIDAQQMVNSVMNKLVTERKRIDGLTDSLYAHTKDADSHPYWMEISIEDENYSPMHIFTLTGVMLPMSIAAESFAEDVEAFFDGLEFPSCLGIALNCTTQGGVQSWRLEFRKVATLHVEGMFAKSCLSCRFMVDNETSTEVLEMEMCVRRGSDDILISGFKQVAC